MVPYAISRERTFQRQSAQSVFLQDVRKKGILLSRLQMEPHANEKAIGLVPPGNCAKVCPQGRPRKIAVWGLLTPQLRHYIFPTQMLHLVKQQKKQGKKTSPSLPTASTACCLRHSQELPRSKQATTQRRSSTLKLAFSAFLLGNLLQRRDFKLPKERIRA